MRMRTHTAAFNRWDCPDCGSTHFTPIAHGAEFDYSSRSAKYAAQGYLKGSAFRWAHREAISLPWNGRRTLEIGCFNGFMVRALTDAGAQAAGFDVNQDAIMVGRELFGLDERALICDWDTVQKSGKYDDILCFDVLEHLESPQSFLASLQPLLAPDARLLLAGPTSERLFRDKSDFPPHHRWWFTHAGLRKMMQGLGYQEERVWIERNAVLMLRNIAGRVLHGYGKREFHGDTGISGDALDQGIVGKAYRAAERAGVALFRLLDVQYCSAMFLFRQTGRQQQQPSSHD